MNDIAVSIDGVPAHILKVRNGQLEREPWDWDKHIQRLEDEAAHWAGRLHVLLQDDDSAPIRVRVESDGRRVFELAEAQQNAERADVALEAGKYQQWLEGNRHRNVGVTSLEAHPDTSSLHRGGTL